MSPLAWKSQSPEVYKAWLEQIDKDCGEDDLTPWENRFLTDIRSKVVNGWPLTQFQAEKLEEIYATYTS